MRLRLVLITAAAIVSALTACSLKSGYLPGEVLYEPTYATSFRIYACGESSSLLRVTDPWQGADGVTEDLFISRDGESAPEGFTGITVTCDPVSVVCLSSSHIAFLEALGRADAVTGVSGAGYVWSDHVHDRIEGGLAVDIGYDSALNYEAIASVRPDIALIYGLTGDETGMRGKLSEMGIGSFYIGDYLEQSPLGKAEWIVALGEIFGCREKAEEIFEGIEERYSALCALALQADMRPTVMLNSPYRDTWFVPGDRSYMVRLIEDAGGKYACSGHDDAVSRPLSYEAAYICLSGSDFWLNPTDADSISDLTSMHPRLSGTPPIVNGCVYCSDLRRTDAGGSDFWESGALMADLVLEDMIGILHPELLHERDMHYFRKLER